MPVDPHLLYQQLGRLIECMPDLAAPGHIGPEMNLWLGRACALVEAGGNLTDYVNLELQIGKLHSHARGIAAQRIHTILYRALARAELQAPAGAAGSFIPIGNSFDAFTALARIFKDAKKDVLIVDPHLNESALTEFGVAVPENVQLRLLADSAHKHSTLAPAASKWVSQFGTMRPLGVRLAPPETLHDRAIFIDGTAGWNLNQSLRDFARHSPAEIVRADEMAALKIPAYEAVWNSAQVVI